MTTFHVNEHIVFDCERKKTRTAFKHEGELFVRGKCTSAKICYMNRTWERFEFESLLRKLADKAKLTPDDAAAVRSFIDNYQEPNETFNTIRMVAAIGDVLCNTSAEKIDWKKRMLKAGLGDAVHFPDDWDLLSDEEKERRINGALEALK